jgi:catechol 2,3-dioxygenase-like lactoylglutathione lyase family enzyme
MDLQIVRAELAAPRDGLDTLARFYAGALALDCRQERDALRVTVGPAELVLVAGDGAPFHHFALLVPGDRFDAARDWLAAATPLLDTRPFDFWDAQAAYVHDPAGNIVELIAHRGEAENRVTGPFAGAELAGISEVGIVGPGLASAAAALEDELGLPLWSGSVDDDATGLGFVGRKAHTLILAGPGRGWLPTGRPAEVHPVAVTIAGGERAGEVVLPGGRVSRVPG